MSIFAVKPEDFEPIENLPDFFSGVYLLYNEDDEIIYVGQSGDVPARVKTHKRRQAWRTEISYASAYLIASEDDRLTLEALIFLRERPRHNRALKLAKRVDGTIYEIQFVGRNNHTTSGRKIKRKKT